ncbi:MAG TPA: transporter substrate-binding domain-containing protein [Chlamydiales bacterium]|nr:transporter substrate-binding domain-containing protein [Chlamydiales bacterium]
MRLLFLFLLILHGCGGSSRGTLRIGIDPNWYPLNFGQQASYVNGFTEDMLIEMARYSGIEFEKIPANWDTLLDGLTEKRYDAVFTSMEPYVFNTAKYDFSANFLDLGPVLIVPVAAPSTQLSKMDGQLIGIISGDPAALVLETHPSLVIRSYPSVPDLLNAVARGDIQGALLDRIPAVKFTNDLYAGKLKIASAPLTQKGLHLIAPKNRSNVVKVFMKNLESLKRRKTIDALQKKWQLE